MYTAEKAASLCGVSVALVKRLAKDRGIGQKFGKAWMFTDEDIERIRNREDLRTKTAPQAEAQDADGSPSPAVSTERS